jgi:Fur family iron response transcriptional regulator
MKDTHELIDCDQMILILLILKNKLPGKKINSVEVLIKVASDNQNQN